MSLDPSSRRQPGRTDRSVHLAHFSWTRRAIEWLTPEEIVLEPAVRDRAHALDFAAASIGRRHRIDPVSIFHALWRREQVGSTAFGSGIAIPHARVQGLEHPVTLFLRAAPPIDFRAPDGEPVDSIIVIAVPADGSPDDHLRLLALLASMLSERAFRARLSTEVDAAGIRRAFADWPDAAVAAAEIGADGRPVAGLRTGSQGHEARGETRRRSLFARRTSRAGAG